MYKNLFHGAISVTELNDVYTAKRFNKEMLDFYASEKEMFISRSHSSAGITMEFYTSSKEISFDYILDYFCREAFTLDIYEDDVFSATYPLSIKFKTGTVRYTKKNQGESKIVIYLPFTANMNVCNINFGDYKPVCKDNLTKYLAIGDSITQGMGSEMISMSYPNTLARDLNYNYRNVGVGGFYFNEKSLDENCSFNPDIITVKYGTNDAGIDYTDEEFCSVISKYFAKLYKIYPNAKTYVITPVWRGNDMTHDRLRKLDVINNSIKEECNKYNYTVIDGLKIAPNMMEAFPDGIHPNMLACSEMVKHIKTAMSK